MTGSCGMSVLTSVFFFPYNQLSFTRPRKVSCEQPSADNIPEVAEPSEPHLKLWSSLLGPMSVSLMDKWRTQALLLLLRTELGAGLFFSAASSVFNTTIYSVPSRNCPCLLASLSFFFLALYLLGFGKSRNSSVALFLTVASCLWGAP